LTFNQEENAMPELPEVETTVNDLRPDVVGRRIAGVHLLWEGTVATPSPEHFRQGLKGRKIVSLSRRGKHLIFALDDGKFLIVHMRMTGSLLLKEADEEPEKFVRVIIYLDDGTAIHFRDMRRFGRMWLVAEKQEVVGSLGPEPLEPEFTPEVLAKILKNRQPAVKGLLLDQRLIAGIGNMYADEALYNARIHPLRPGNSLSKAEIARLHEAIQKVLRLGIRNKGASTETYIRPGGVKGEAQLQFQVAHQKGRECPCGGKVERIVVQQRGTFFCPRCQKMKGERKNLKGKATSQK
jgi:formamidopyrimidine-DNA glycosylase